ncbi:MAG: tRNA preQ1(34) S-adenosylmethionine ribosyltransferase-isomerase QueA [Gammaproteobacteria bacterium]|nr:tRNA preQ1(34) S-adenosylmethionine ribosyltransferase-isomerase QueA [Gammaproteobacteria bacterium]
MRLSDFQYDLPLEMIARYPLPERSASRLLCLEGSTGNITHAGFEDILSLLTPKDLLVFNNTKVIPARLRGTKETGGRVEMLVERILDDHRVLAHVRASKALRVNSFVQFAGNVQFEMLGRQDDLFELGCTDSRPVLEVLETIGEIPLPVYFQREAEESDKERYQTVYAQHKGSVAAPTAGLHFDAKLLEQLKVKGVQMAFLTLHVGAGTFAPVRVEQIEEHKMHPEYLEVTEELCEKVRLTKANGGRVIAVGTTSARSLETASASGEILPFSGNTSIFIYPGYQFKCVDALITNLHVPGSTLLMMVSAFAGYEQVMHAYQVAVEQGYRFYSYGDAMFVTIKKAKKD